MDEVALSATPPKSNDKDNFDISKIFSPNIQEDEKNKNKKAKKTNKKKGNFSLF